MNITTPLFDVLLFEPSGKQIGRRYKQNLTQVAGLKKQFPELNLKTTPWIAPPEPEVVEEPKEVLTDA